MPNDDSNFLSRWSRRKVVAKDGRGQDSDAEGLGDEPGASNRQAAQPVHQPGRMNTDPPLDEDVDGQDLALATDLMSTEEITDPDEFSDLQEMRRQGIDEQGESTAVSTPDAHERDPTDDEDRLLSEEDFADVDFDALDYKSDYTRFMGKNVPEKIRDRALRKLWGSDPILANVDGLNDYCEDFSDAVWVVPNLRTSYKVGQGFLTDEEAAEWDALGKPEKPGEVDGTQVAELDDSPEAIEQPVGTEVEDMAGASIREETPDQPEVAQFLTASDAYAAGLYPADSNHLVPLADLMAPNVRFVVARLDGKAVGCGALVLGNDETAELKRLWVDPGARGTGTGRSLVEALETCARANNASIARLETGIHQPEALALYRNCGYGEIEAFGNYEPDPLSTFMEKKLA